MNNDGDKRLLITNAVLCAVALTMILILIVGDFRAKWLTAAGLGCVVAGNLMSIIAILIRNRVK